MKTIIENELPIAERSIEISKAMIKPCVTNFDTNAESSSELFKGSISRELPKAYKSLFKALSYDEILTYVACSYC